MFRETVSRIMLFLLLVSMLALVFNTQPVQSDYVWSETIYIHADGSIEPVEAPIFTVDSVTYTFTDNIVVDVPEDSSAIVIERDNIVLDGAGYTLQRTEAYKAEGITLSGRTNVTVKNTQIENFIYGIRLVADGYCSISGNNIIENKFGIDLRYSSSNSISGNNITNNMGGIQLHDSSNNVVSENNITNNLDGIILDSSSNNNISGNTLHVYDSYQNSVVDNTVNGKPLVYLEGVVEYTVGDAGQVVLVNSDSIRVENLNLSRTSIGVQLWETTNSIIDGNNIVNNGYGIWLDSSSNNSINGNNITANNWGGIQLHDSSNNVVSENNITNNRDGIVLSSSSSNSISGNNVTANNDDGIALGSSSSNSISGNNIANNEYGVALYESSYNSISMNKITTNERGIHIQESSSNMVSGNNITANSEAGTWLHRSSDNSIYHNNFIDNSQQVYDYAWDSPHVSPSTNLWDDSYTGNFWSDYEERYPNATEIDDSGIWNTPYVIDANNRDRHPLMGPCTPPEHELLVSINAPTSLWLGSSSSLDAIVTNEGLNDEVDVELLLLINGTLADSRTILLLQAGDSYRLSYLWTPTNEETYNVTAYARPVLGEVSVENNQKTKFVTVAEVEVGVKAGDWIKCTYTISGWPGGQPYPEWLRVEFLTVEGTNATVYVTMRMSDGTEQSDTMTVDVAVGGGTFQGLSGFVIPANCTTGDSIYITGHGNLAIAGESTRIYAGASRTVVYANFSFQGNQLTYYWDKHTGVMVESSAIYPQLNITATAKATETNMWQAKPLLVGDLDNDGKVGIQDLAVAAKVFGSYPGHPRWNPIADINKDNTTNIVDLVLIAKNFGKNQQN